MCMPSGELESLLDIIRVTAIEVLGITDEAAANFAQIATSRATGFFLRFDDVPDRLILKDVVFDGKRFIAEWESISKQACCPECGKTSEQEQSRHLFSQNVQDVGINGIPLWHKINRKNYICTNDHCLQKTF